MGVSWSERVCEHAVCVCMSVPCECAIVCECAICVSVPCACQSCVSVPYVSECAV